MTLTKRRGPTATAINFWGTFFNFLSFSATPRPVGMGISVPARNMFSHPTTSLFVLLCRGRARSKQRETCLQLSRSSPTVFLKKRGGKIDKVFSERTSETFKRNSNRARSTTADATFEISLPALPSGVKVTQFNHRTQPLPQCFQNFRLMKH